MNAPAPVSAPEFAVDVSHVTKEFVLSQSARSLKTAVIDLVRRGRAKRFTALSDVSFQVRKGETVGLIGHNGAGKSTLLSIIARTMTPTHGHVTTSGAVSSLLELGAGFHPDLTGRENVLLYGAIMGIPRETMRERFDAIVDFSGLREFIDQPVRFYSSGMYVRLGFSVAVQVNPDILLVDEVLAVGDSDFQRRCLEKMEEFRRAGKSMLLISHDISAIRRVSDRIAYLSHGHLIGMGSPEELARQYEDDTLRTAAGISGSAQKDEPKIPPRLAARHREWGTREASIESIEWVDESSGKTDAGIIGKVARTLHLRLHYYATHRIENPVFGFSIEELDGGRCVYGSNTQIEKHPISAIDGRGVLELQVDVSRLQAGDYALSFALHSADHTQNYHRLEAWRWLHITEQKPGDGLCVLPVSWS